MWEHIDNQEVGLEAATLERKRNSSLVKCTSAENITGLSYKPKLRAVRKYSGRGAFSKSVKVYREERWRYRKSRC